MIVFPESKRYVPSLEQARAANEPQMYSDPGATMEQRFAGYSATTPRVEKFMDLLNLVALAQKAEQNVVSLAAMRTAGEGTSFVAESELSKGLKDILKHRRLAGKAANYSELPPEFQQMYSTALGKGPVATSRYKEIFEAENAKKKYR